MALDILWEPRIGAGSAALVLILLLVGRRELLLFADTGLTHPDFGIRMAPDLGPCFCSGTT